MLTAQAQRAISRCQFLSHPPYSEEKAFLFRPYLSQSYHQAQRQIALWMQEAGIQSRIDPAGNLIGSYAGQTPDAPVLLIGSHLDTVRNAGCFDGNLGIMLGIEVIHHFHQRHKQFPFGLEIIAFGDEEGSRFPIAMLTSRAVAGLLTAPPSGLKDPDDISIEDAFHQANLDYRKIRQAAHDPRKTIAYLETHIEQGPVLEAQNLPVSAVSGIAAQYRFQVTLLGQASHAGTTSMNLRQDTLAGAAEIIYQLEQMVQNSSQENGVITTGQILAEPGSPNVIAGKTVFSIDLRAPTNEQRNRLAETMQHHIHAICQRRNLKVQVTTQHDLSATFCDPALTDLLQQAIRETGHPAHIMTSGAGHDAMIMAHLTPVAMLFIRTPNGISHSPEEQVLEPDVAIALESMINFINLKEKAS